MVQCKRLLTFYCAAHIIARSTLGRPHAAVEARARARKEVTMTANPNIEDFQDFSKKQLEAIASASQTWTQGLQDLAAESTDYSKKAFTTGSATWEKLL